MPTNLVHSIEHPHADTCRQSVWTSQTLISEGAESLSSSYSTSDGFSFSFRSSSGAI